MKTTDVIRDLDKKRSKHQADMKRLAEFKSHTDTISEETVEEYVEEQAREEYVAEKTKTEIREEWQMMFLGEVIPTGETPNDVRRRWLRAIKK